MPPIKPDTPANDSPADPPAAVPDALAAFITLLARSAARQQAANLNQPPKQDRKP